MLAMWALHKIFTGMSSHVQQQYPSSGHGLITNSTSKRFSIVGVQTLVSHEIVLAIERPRALVANKLT